MQGFLETLERAEGAQSQGAKAAAAAGAGEKRERVEEAQSQGATAAAAAGAGEKRERLEEEVARLHDENVRLRRELEAARWQPGHSLAGAWRKSRGVCVAALAVFGFALSAGLALLCCPRRKSKRSGPAAGHASPAPSPRASARPDGGRAGPEPADQAKSGLEDSEDEDASEYDLTWFEASCPMIFRPVKACRGALKLLTGLFKLLCCSLSRDGMVAAFLVVACWAAGLGLLWHLGYLQPILKTLVVYVYFLFFLVVFLILLLAEVGKRFADKMEAGFEVAELARMYLQDLLKHFHLHDGRKAPTFAEEQRRESRRPRAPESKGRGPQTSQGAP